MFFFYLKTIASNNMTTIFYTCIKNTRILPLKKRCYMIDIIKKLLYDSCLAIYRIVLYMSDASCRML